MLYDYDYMHENDCIISQANNPNFLDDILLRSDSWLSAMKEELKSLQDSDV